MDEYKKMNDDIVSNAKIDELYIAVNLAMIGLFEDYTIPNSKSDDKPNDTLGLLK